MFATGHTVAAAVAVVTAGSLARSMQVPVPSTPVRTTAVLPWIQAPPTTTVKVPMLLMRRYGQPETPMPTGVSQLEAEVLRLTAACTVHVLTHSTVWY